MESGCRIIGNDYLFRGKSCDQKVRVEMPDAAAIKYARSFAPGGQKVIDKFVG